MSAVFEWCGLLFLESVAVLSVKDAQIEIWNVYAGVCILFENLKMNSYKKISYKCSWWDLNPQSLVPKTSALSIRPQEQLITVDLMYRYISHIYLILYTNNYVWLVCKNARILLIAGSFSVARRQQPNASNYCKFDLRYKN